MTDIHLKITSSLLERVRLDLARPHPFAFERVGFVTCRAALFGNVNLILLALDYLVVEDADYVKSDNYGALMGADAIRKALQYTYHHPVGMFHVHLHNGRGLPRFSDIDEREMRKFVPNFFHVRTTLPHGALVLSSDRARGYCWIARTGSPNKITRITVVGRPMREIGDDRG